MCRLLLLYYDYKAIVYISYNVFWQLTMSAQWKNGICGCFGNCGMCIVTWFVPCYTLGKTAEAVGENCLLCGLLLFVPLANIVAPILVRGKVREAKGIAGSIVGDFCVHLFCGPCALCQEYQEMYPDSQASAQAISRQWRWRIHHFITSASSLSSCNVVIWML